MTTTTETKTADELLFGHYLRTGQRLCGPAAAQFLERKFNQRHYRENGQFARTGEGINYGGGAAPRSNDPIRQSRSPDVAQRHVPVARNQSNGSAPAGQMLRLRTNDQSTDRADEIVVTGDAKLQKLRDDFDAALRGKPAVRPSSVTSTRHRELIARLGSVITVGEGGYESYNTGTSGVKDQKVGHSFVRNAKGTVTGKTINQILATKGLSGYDKRRMFATGKYQTTIETLAAAKAALHLTGNELYSADLQERVFREFLISKAGGGKLEAFIHHGRGTVDEAQYAASKEWASIAVPAGRTDKNGIVSNGNRSYFQKAGQNAASAKATRALRALLVDISAGRKLRSS